MYVDSSAVIDVVRITSGSTICDSGYFVRATDAPTYVQYGAADIGVAGKDVLIEHGGDGLYQPLDLKIAKCRMMVAIPAGFDYENAVRQGARLRVHVPPHLDHSERSAAQMRARDRASRAPAPPCHIR